ncbi:MAG: hypothetical protein ACMG6E_09970 [Candidatus Roizmanbacteria bacterium]
MSKQKKRYQKETSKKHNNEPRKLGQDQYLAPQMHMIHQQVVSK